jgi:hypothetical protein
MKVAQSCLAGVALFASSLARPTDSAETLSNNSHGLDAVASVGYATMNGG